MAQQRINQGFVLNCVKYATNKMHCYRRTHVIFDRYNTSIKDATRCQRACEAAKEYKLTMNAPLPQQQVVLSVTKNKVHLIDLICEELQQLDDVPLNTTLVITGRSLVPMEVRSDALVQRFDLKTTHEEADVIIPQQVVALADMGCKTINVICDDTDVFVLLAHYFAEESLTVSLIMESTSRSRSSIDIGATVAKHSDIVPQLTAAHAVSRCDTVGCYHDIGKTKVVKALSAGIELNHSGDPKASLDDVMKESTHFIGACYGHQCDPSDTMSSIRYKVWVSHTGRKVASILPKLKSLPPTVEAFRKNVKRPHFQACIWKAALQQDPPELDPLEFGWESEGPSGAYCPVKLKLPLQIYLS